MATKSEERPGSNSDLLLGAGAEFEGKADLIGSLTVGKTADIVVIHGDPSANINDIEKVEIVFKDGVGYDPVKLRDSVRGIVGIRYGSTFLPEKTQRESAPQSFEAAYAFTNSPGQPSLPNCRLHGSGALRENHGFPPRLCRSRKSWKPVAWGTTGVKSRFLA